MAELLEFNTQAECEATAGSASSSMRRGRSARDVESGRPAGAHDADRDREVVELKAALARVGRERDFSVQWRGV